MSLGEINQAESNVLKHRASIMPKPRFRIHMSPQLSHLLYTVFSAIFAFTNLRNVQNICLGVSYQFISPKALSFDFLHYRCLSSVTGKLITLCDIHMVFLVRLILQACPRSYFYWSVYGRFKISFTI